MYRNIFGFAISLKSIALFIVEAKLLNTFNSVTKAKPKN